MRKFILFALIFVTVCFTLATKISAVEAEPDANTYTEDTTITINLTASPQEDENGVAVNLVAEGLTILNYTPPAQGDWIGTIPDCENSERYTSKTVCVLLAKPSSIEAGESLGTVSVLVKGGGKGILTKTSNNVYSDGVGSRVDQGELIVFNEGFDIIPVVETPPSNNPENNETPVSPNVSKPDNTLNLAVVGAGIVIVLVFIVVAVLLAKKQKQTSSTSTSTSTNSSTPF